ncbi:accessory gene regulator B family protein [Ruminococcus bicirculans (ex Wegman et al. 2014)]|uniref:accessory gene regulator B family protein n=1 Tax=Ruminococcus bicirculans (ex Wegman et al. 2014) TaxID=1160721 RepID=UPI003FD8A389
MKRLVSIILNFMIKNNVISKDTEEIEFYRYGIEITLSSLINIALISIIGIVTNYTFESTMFLAVFIIMRSVKCNLVTSISFVILLLIFKIIRHVSLKSIILIAIFQVVTIVLLAPIENKNKPIENRTVYKIISTVLSVVLSAISIVLIIKGVDLGLIILLTLALVSRFMKRGDFL